MDSVAVPLLPPNCFEILFGDRRAQEIRAAVEGGRSLLQSRSVWHINASSRGGSVAESVRTFLGYKRSVGIDARWAVIEADSEFRDITARVLAMLQGHHANVAPLTDADREHYVAVSKRNAGRLSSVVAPRDVVVLHDPHTAGLIPVLREQGALVLWRCHLGHAPTEQAAVTAWDFLRPDLEKAHALVFSLKEAVPSWADPATVQIIPPSIDAFSVKNQPMSRAAVRATTAFIGLTGSSESARGPCFSRASGDGAWIQRRAEIVQEAPVPGPHIPIVAQVSHWDASKDRLGVMRAFVERLDAMHDAHLAIVGPDPSALPASTGATAIYDACVTEWERLRPEARSRVHIVALPMADTEEHAVLVNAIQRHARVIVHKSLREGFSIGVTEGMWKGRPIVVSAVGGVSDQITHQKHGLHFHDDDDHRSFADALSVMIADRALGRRYGRNARRRCVAEFLEPRQTIRFLELVDLLEKR